MRTSRTTLLALPLLLLAQASAQTDADSAAIHSMRADVRHLASASLEGREAGTPGELLAAEYIADRFSELGLVPMGDDGTYMQAFTFNATPVRGANNGLRIATTSLTLDDQFHPVALSPSGTARGKLLQVDHGIRAPELEHDDLDGLDLKDRVVVMSVGSPDGVHPHSKFLAHHDIRGRIDQVAGLGAVGVLLYNDDATAATPDARLSAKVQPVTIPVVFIQHEALTALLLDNNPVVIQVDIVREERTAYNVMGLLENGVGRATVVGGHYDHLGWGDEGSRHRGEPAIHHGADDNASGTAILMQLARDLKEMEDTRGSDHLFIAFSGEEKGLYGSNYWTKNSTYPLDSINYMINLDMVGMLDSLGSIGINGVGTSPSWSVVDSITTGELTIKSTLGGIGSSDHTSFYLQDIPAVHFFTGTHEHYHKPTDTWEKLNYPGMLRVTRYIEDLMTRLDGRGLLEFTRTEEENAAATPRFKVTMGVVPDYMYSGTGMRIDGITEGKPAAAAGLTKGDIVVRMGELEVADMMGYMKALGQFNKGDTAPVKVLREGKEVMVEVTF